ncbi:hypothetical protein [Propionivibrio soli]|uniref:hypothetical protein n=1 Tax=Propionivibrio soli TaxID=2976531 RepID=UPI0021E734FE|nr:hypothetical protein [Propionivibrio soli]
MMPTLQHILVDQRTLMAAGVDFEKYKERLLAAFAPRRPRVLLVPSTGDESPYPWAIRSYLLPSKGLENESVKQLFAEAWASVTGSQ